MNHEEYERMYRFEDTYWWFVSRRRLIASLLNGYYPQEGRLRLLDIGCGTGAMLDMLAPFGEVVGADFAPQALEFCRARGAESGENYPLSRADVRCLPFAAHSFDAVTAMDVIEHIDDDKAASSEIYRVLRPGGRLFVTVPAYRFLWSEHDEALHHYRRYTAPQLKDLFQRVGFTVPKLSYAVTSLFPAVVAYRLIARALPKQRSHGQKHADLVTFSPRVNTALRALNDWETRLMQTANLPFGVTVVAVAQKPAEGEGAA